MSLACLGGDAPVALPVTFPRGGGGMVPFQARGDTGRRLSPGRSVPSPLLPSAADGRAHVCVTDISSRGLGRRMCDSLWLRRGTAPRSPHTSRLGATSSLLLRLTGTGCGGASGRGGSPAPLSGGLPVPVSLKRGGLCIAPVTCAARCGALPHRSTARDGGGGGSGPAPGRASSMLLRRDLRELCGMASAYGLLLSCRADPALRLSVAPPPCSSPLCRCSSSQRLYVEKSEMWTSRGIGMHSLSSAGSHSPLLPCVLMGALRSLMGALRSLRGALRSLSGALSVIVMLLAHGMVDR